jgi:hypothetical protein
MKRCSLAFLSMIVLLPSIRAQYPSYQYLSCPTCQAQAGGQPNAQTMLAALQAQQQAAQQPALQAGAGVSLNLTAGQIWALAQEDARVRAEREQLERDRVALLAAQSADRNRAALAYAGGGLGGLGGVNALDGLGVNNLSQLYAMNALAGGGCATCGLNRVNLAGLGGCLGGTVGGYSIPLTLDLSVRRGYEYDRGYDRGYCPACYDRCYCPACDYGREYGRSYDLGYRNRSWEYGEFEFPTRTFVYNYYQRPEPFYTEERGTCGASAAGGERFSFNGGGEGVAYEAGEREGTCGRRGGRERIRFSMRRR